MDIGIGLLCESLETCKHDSNSLGLIVI